MRPAQFIILILLLSSRAQGASIAELQNSVTQLRLDAQALSHSTGHPIHPWKIRDVAARRFINRPDWERFVAEGGKNPRDVYEPKPATWNNWQITTDTEVQKAVDEKLPLTIDSLLSWNKIALQNTVPDYVHGGELKLYGNYGGCTSRNKALTAKEVEALLSVRFENENESALKWIPLVCAEDLPAKMDLPGPNPECQLVWDKAQRWKNENQFWSDTANSMDLGVFTEQWYWFACWPRSLPALQPNHESTQCGMIVYPQPETVRIRLQKILDQVNEYFTTQGSPKDPIRFALKIQRQLVALHPFNKGNGRGSRWVMDYITLRSGLPPILIRNMDFDLSTDFETYVAQGYDGATEALTRAATCLNRYSKESYQELQKTICGMLDPITQFPASPARPLLHFRE